MLTLQPAITGTDRAEIIRRIAEDEPEPIRRLNPAVPVDLATIVTKALSKEPASRYETAWQLADDLDRFLDGRPIAARPVGPLARSGGGAGASRCRPAWRRPWCWPWSAASPESPGTGARRCGSGRVRPAGRQDGSGAEPGRQGRRDQPVPDRRSSAPGRPRTTTRRANRITLSRHSTAPPPRSARRSPASPRSRRPSAWPSARPTTSLGEYAKSEAQYPRRVGNLGPSADGPGREGLDTLDQLGHTLGHLERLDEAERLLRRAVDETERLLGPRHENFLSAIEHLATVLGRKSRYDEAENTSPSRLERLSRGVRARARQDPDRNEQPGPCSHQTEQICRGRTDPPPMLGAQQANSWRREPRDVGEPAQPGGDTPEARPPR